MFTVFNKRTLSRKNEFAIIGTMRSGSNLLQRLLDSYDGVFCHGELFNPTFIGFHPNFENEYLGYKRADVEKRNANLDLFFEVLREDRKKQILGYRIFEKHYLFNKILKDENIIKVLLYRPLLDSYISLKIAQQTDQWLLKREKDRKNTAPIHLNMKAFERYCYEKDRFYDRLHHVLATTKQKYQKVEFHQVLNVHKLNKVAKFIGSTERKKQLEVDLIRQNPGTIKDKIENYNETIDLIGKMQKDGTVTNISLRAYHDVE